MKKDYVNLKVQVIEVQLSDCIAGSGTQVSSLGGTTRNQEINNVEDVVITGW